MINKEIIDLVQKYYKDKKDKGGNNYLYHLYYVSNKMRTREGKIAGLLHDIMEDSKCSFQELENARVPVESIRVIDILTRKENETYKEYIYRIVNSNNIMAIKIKIIDLENNMDLSRIPNYTEKDKQRIYNRYLPAYLTLLRSLEKILSEYE